MKRAGKIVIAGLATVGLMGFGATAASADTVDIERVGSSNSYGIDGFLPADLAVAPANVSVPYPTTDPVGWQEFRGNATLFRAETRPGGDELYLYCAEILLTAVEFYGSVDRDVAEIGNAGHVARIVSTYYPFTDAPTELANNNERAGAVQYAIWYFTDSFVVAEDEPLRDAVAEIVNDTLEAGPLAESPLDLTFTLTGPTGTFDTGDIVGPFQVTSAVATTTFTIDAGTATVYSDAAGTTVIPAGTALDAGEQFWVRGTEPGDLTIAVDGNIAVPSGLYFTAVPGQDGMGDPQTLISASATNYDAAASAVVTFDGEVPTEALPATGAEATPSAAVAGMLLLGGLMAVAAARVARRRVG